MLSISKALIFWMNKLVGICACVGEGGLFMVLVGFLLLFWKQFWWNSPDWIETHNLATSYLSLMTTEARHVWITVPYCGNHLFILVFLKIRPIYPRLGSNSLRVLKLLTLRHNSYLLSTWVTGSHQQDQLNFNMVLSGLESIKGDILCKSVGLL